MPEARHHGDLVPGEVNVVPTQRDQLTTSQAGVCGDADQFGVLGILDHARGELVIADALCTRVAVSAGGERACERFDLFAAVEGERTWLRLRPPISMPCRVVRQLIVLGRIP